MLSTNSTKQVLFRLDFGGAIGLGHLARCAYLSKALTRLGHSTVLMSDVTGTGASDRAAKFVDLFSEFIGLNSRDSSLDIPSESIIRLMSEASPELIIVDHYAATEPFLSQLRAVAPVLAISDGSTPRNADFVLKYGTDELLPMSGAPQSPVILSGKQFSLVNAAHGFSIEQGVKVATEVVISLGGGPQRALIENVVEKVRSLDASGSGVILGPMKVLSLSNHGESNKLRLEFGSDQFLPELLSSSRRAIVTGGVSLLEAIAQGVPAVALVTAENQLHGLNVLSQSEHVIVAKDLDFFKSSAFVDWWHWYDSYVERKNAELSLRSMVDSYGPDRVALGIGLGAKSELKLREATESDVPILFRWRNEAVSGTGTQAGATVLPQEHIAWFKGISETNSKLWIAEFSGLPVGQVRFAKGSHFEGLELSYSIDQHFRGRGFGTRILRMATAQPEIVDNIWARVHRENITSIRALVSAGFVGVEPNGQEFSIFKYSKPESPTTKTVG